MNISLEVIAGCIINGGVLVWVLRSYAGKVDRHSDLLPKIAANLDASTNTQQLISSCIEELFKSRNEHEKRLTKIETIHDANGCNSGGRRAYDPEKRCGEEQQ